MLLYFVITLIFNVSSPKQELVNFITIGLSSPANTHTYTGISLCSLTVLELFVEPQTPTMPGLLTTGFLELLFL